MANTQNRAGSLTRRKIIDLLKQSGPLTAGHMADELDLTPMAVRQQLYTLEAEGLAASQAEPSSGRGRPNKLWALTEAAQTLFPDAHQDLAVDLITTVQETLGADAFDALLKARGQKQVAQYRDQMAEATTLEARAQALARIRTGEGYMADTAPLADGTGWQLVENHCPVCAAAKACSGICANELDVFQAALGDAYVVTRTDHILAGARRCAYEIRPARDETGSN